MSTEDKLNGGNGSSPDGESVDDETDQDEALHSGEIEIFTISDELGFGVHVSCHANTATADLVAGLTDLLSQITQAIILHPEIKRAGDLPLGDDAF